MKGPIRGPESDGAPYEVSRPLNGRPTREIRKSLVERARRASLRLTANRRAGRSA
jgi:hypothetical protein